MADESMKLLENARPHVEEVPPSLDLVARIVAIPRRRHSRRFGASIAAVAAVAAIALIAAVVTETRQPSLDIALVASKSRAAFDSGRADVRWATGKADYAQSGVTHVAFSGDDMDMTLDIEGSKREPGFQAQNRTVDGDFYLYDGVPGHKTWVRDTSRHGAKRSELFSVDPRTLLDVLSPSAKFSEIADEGGVRHLRASSVKDVPAVNLGLGPTSGQTLKGLDVWVTSDDIVQRIDLAFQTTVVEKNSGAMARLVKQPDGTTRKEIDPAHPGETRTITTHSSYSARFFDIGAPITISRPEEARDIAAVG